MMWLKVNTVLTDSVFKQACVNLVKHQVSRKKNAPDLLCNDRETLESVGWFLKISCCTLILNIPSNTTQTVNCDVEKRFTCFAGPVDRIAVEVTKETIL